MTNKLVKVRIYAEEEYPFYSEVTSVNLLSTDFGIQIDVEENTLKRWRRVLTEIRIVQDEMADLADKYYESNSKNRKNENM